MPELECLFLIVKNNEQMSVPPGLQTRTKKNECHLCSPKKLVTEVLGLYKLCSILASSFFSFVLFRVFDIVNILVSMFVHVYLNICWFFSLLLNPLNIIE